MNFFTDYDNTPNLEIQKEYRVVKVSYTPVFSATLIINTLTINTENNNTILLDKVESLNRALFNDTVLYCSQKGMVTSVIKEYNPEIVGIVNTNSIVTYGKTDRGIPYYLFKPYNKNYPNFIVPFDKKKHGISGTDLIVVIKRQKWLTTKKYPIGIITEYIGSPGILSNEIDAILVRYDLFRKDIPNRIIKDEPLKDMPSLNDNTIYKDFLEKDVFSIDPPNCIDIDDAMHIEKLGDNSTESSSSSDGDGNSDKKFIIGIHIANPAYFLPIDGLHDLSVKNRLTSIYTPVKRIDMLHPDLAIEKASLLKDKIRLVNSVLFTIAINDNNDSYNDNNSNDRIKYKIESVKFESAFIKNKENLNYDEADAIYKDNKPFLKDSLQNLFMVTNNLLIPFKENKKVKDTHELVEIWMILTNWYIGRELVKRYDGLAPIRVQKDTNPINMISTKTVLNERLEKILTIKRNNNAALYQLYKSDNDLHASLGICQYTHFTSPIRRYFDIIIHRMIFPNSLSDKDHNYNYDKESLIHLLNSINKKNQLVKKAERAFNKVKIVNTLLERETTSTETMTIIDFTDTSLELYSEKWDTIIKYKLIPRLLKKKFVIKAFDNTALEQRFKDIECNNYQTLGLNLESIDNNSILHTFHIFDKITLKSYPSAKNSKMELNHELIEPFISFY